MVVRTSSATKCVPVEARLFTLSVKVRGSDDVFFIYLASYGPYFIEGVRWLIISAKGLSGYLCELYIGLIDALSSQLLMNVIVSCPLHQP